MLQTDKTETSKSDIFKLILSVVVVVGMSFVFYYLGNMPVQDEPLVVEVGFDDFVPEYLNQTENIQIPGGFPVGLLEGDGIELLNGSYLINEKDSMEEYLFSVYIENKTAEEAALDAEVVMRENGFSTFVTNESPFMVLAQAPDLSGGIVYSVSETPSGMFASVTYSYFVITEEFINIEDISI